MQPSLHRTAPLALLALAGCRSAAPADAGSADAAARTDVAPAVTDAPAAIDAAWSAAPPRCAFTGPPPMWASAEPRQTLAARCGDLTLRAQAWGVGILRLRYLPGGVERAARPWAVSGIASPPRDAWVGARGASVSLCTADLDLSVDPACRVTVRDAMGRTLFEDGEGGGWSRATETLGGRARTLAVRRWRLDAADRLYGFGERNGPFERRGTRAVFWNTDPYESRVGGVPPDADPLYPSIPFWVTHRDGVAWATLFADTHRMDVTVDDALTARVFDGVIDQYVFAGPSMPAVLERYAAVTGLPAMPPRWALGYHQCRWGYPNAERFEAIGAEFRRRNIPADALWLDIQHMRGFRTFTWDPANFGDPQAMNNRLHESGFHVVTIADPGLKVDPTWDVYNDGLRGGHFLRDARGAVYAGAVWPGPSHFPDFTAEATRAWWGDRVAGLSRVGVDGVWLDVNEPTVFPESGGGSVPDELVTDGDGTPGDMAEAHNAYALLESRATFEGMRRAQPARRPFVLTRAGFAGVQRYAAMWTGDVPSTWTGLRQTLPTLLGLSMSGVPFVGSDVGGYSGRASPELFARWIALGSISPFFRGHVTNGVNDQEPWAFGPEVEAISRARIQERYRLLPYLYSLFDEAARTGAPVLRPMVYEFPQEPALARVDDQAMLGPWLLVAPVTAEGATMRTVVLPRGRWVELDSGAVFEGPGTITVDVTLAALPTFLREGATLVRGPVLQHTAARVVDRLDVDLVPGPSRTVILLYDDDGDGGPAAPRARTPFALQRTADGMRLDIGPREGRHTPPRRTLDLRVRAVDAMPTEVRAGAVELTRVDDDAAAGERLDVWWWDRNDRALRVRVLDRAELAVTARYPTALATDRDTVTVSLSVTLPERTPMGTPITVASSANGWTHVPLTRVANTDTAVGTLTVPRGRWFEYKFARGGWETVERYADCAEARNRYGFGAAHPTRQDTVWQWRDRCP